MRRLALVGDRLTHGVVRILRERAQGETSHPAADPFEPDLTVREALESGILDDETEGEASDLMMQSTRLALEDSWPASEDREKEQAPSAAPANRLKILSVGIAQPTGDLGLRVPLVLEDEQGHHRRLALTISLDPLLDEDL